MILRVEKMSPIPNMPDADFKEAREFTDRGMHGKLYRFSETDFEGTRSLWTGTHPLDGTPLQVVDGLPGPRAGWPTRRRSRRCRRPACTPARSPRSFSG